VDHLDEDRRTSFDRNAEQYDAARPGYPEAAIDAVIARSGIEPGGRIVEVGAGTGKATEPFARRGYSVVALEPGARMAAVLRRHVAQHPRVSIIEATFEDWTGADGSFALLLSAQAFHWVRPEVRYAKAAAALRPGGGFAWINNETADLDPDLRSGLDRAYARWFPKSGRQESKRSDDKVRERIEEIQASGSFEPADVDMFRWSATYSARSYVALLDTYSDHAVQPADVRAGLYGEISQLIEEYGGELEIPYLTVVLFAPRKA